MARGCNFFPFLVPLLLDSPLYSQPVPPFSYSSKILILSFYIKYWRFLLQCRLPPIRVLFPLLVWLFPRQRTQRSLAAISPSPFVATLIIMIMPRFRLLISRYLRGRWSSCPLAYHLFQQNTQNTRAHATFCYTNDASDMFSDVDVETQSFSSVKEIPPRKFYGQKMAVRRSYTFSTLSR